MHIGLPYPLPKRRNYFRQLHEGVVAERDFISIAVNQGLQLAEHVECRLACGVVGESYRFNPVIKVIFINNRAAIREGNLSYIPLSSYVYEYVAPSGKLISLGRPFF